MNKPWYKQFWPWFLIILPLSVVVASITTFVVFSNNKVSLVAEDYYKKEKASIWTFLSCALLTPWE